MAASLAGDTRGQAEGNGRARGKSERRFISGGPGARESALAASQVVLDDDRWIVEETDDEDEEIGFNVDPSFEEVPSGWLERCRWNLSGFGRWTRREDILVLEARAWMKCVERLCKSIYGTNCRQLIHGDNMALILTSVVGGRDSLHSSSSLAAPENETEAIPRRREILLDEAGRRRRLLVCCMANDAAASGMNLLQHGAVGPQTQLNFAFTLRKFGSWLEQREEKVVTDAEIDAAMYTWMENELMQGNPASSGERLLSAWMDKYPSFGRHGARKLPKTWRSLQGWQRLTWTLDETLGCVQCGQGSRADW